MIDFHNVPQHMLVVVFDLCVREMTTCSSACEERLRTIAEVSGR